MTINTLLKPRKREKNIIKKSKYTITAKEETTLEKKNVVDSEINLSEEAKTTSKKIIDFIIKDGEIIILNQGETGAIILEIKTSNPAIIIGRHGHTLDAIQHLVNILVNKKVQENE